MKISTRYIRDIGGMYSIWIEIQGQTDTEYNIYFNEYKRLIAGGEISYSEISSEERLLENGIEYIKRWNEKNLTNQIVPIGLLDYGYGYRASRLKICKIPEEETYKVPMIVEGVIDAIRIKKQGVDMYKKFSKRQVEEIEL